MPSVSKETTFVGSVGNLLGTDIEAGSNGVVEKKHSKSKRPLASKPPMRRRKRNTAARRGHVFAIDADQIFESSQQHESFGEGPMKLKGLDRFEDCESYGVSEEAHKMLVRKEIDKLVSAATQGGPYLFNSHGNLAETTEKGFLEMSHIADQMWCISQIIKHDNAQICLKNMLEQPDRLEGVIDDFKDSRQELMSRFETDKDRVEGAQPIILDPPDRNRALYHAMVDYTLGSVARLIVHSATGSFWIKRSLAVLALWAVKFKVLAIDPSRFAQMSISTGEDVVESLAGQQATHRSVTLLKVRLKPDEADREHETLSAKTNLKHIYFDQNLLFRWNISNLIRYVIFSYVDVDKLGRGGNVACFEECSLVYRTGLDGVLTSLTQDRFKSVHYSSEPADATYLYSGFRLMLSTLGGIQRRNKETQHLNNTAPGATVKWDVVVGPKTRDTNSGLLLYRMDDVISAISAHCMSASNMANCLAAMVRMASSCAREDDIVVPFDNPPRAFQGMVHLFTEERVRQKLKARELHLEDTDVEFVSESPLRRGIRAGTNLDNYHHHHLLPPPVSKTVTTRTTTTGTPDNPLATPTAENLNTEDSTREMLSEYRAHRTKMDAWVIAEDSITVRCQRYVTTVIALAITVVCGGLSVPFAVRNRIPGVDPFQLTTFTWVLTAFLVLLAKSRYVSEWPWHHFLHGRIVCRSVSDLREVTGIDEQMILMYLLHGERDTILTTRGPYNSMFVRRVEGGGGFSVDRPVRLSTMLASGFIVFKVGNESGSHLICQDVRKGASSQYISHDTRASWLACMNLEGDEEEEEDGEEEWESGDGPGDEKGEGGRVNKRDKVFHLKVEEFRWKEIIGLYVRDSLFG